MGITIPIAHDFICPWCWVGLLQAQRLEQEFGATIEWVGHELFPRELEWPNWTPSPEPPANRPKTLSRFEFLLAADDTVMPIAEKPKQMRTYNAHEAVEYAKTEGVANQLTEALYRAYWERGLEINNLEIIRQIATGIVKDVDAMQEAIETERFKDKIIPFDDVSYSIGVYNVPTFYIGGERYAEQPYSALRKAVQDLTAVGSIP